MKKKDVMKAVQKKNSNDNSLKKKKTTKKKTKTNKVKKNQNPEKKIVTVIPPTPKEEIVENNIVPEDLPFKKRLIRFLIKLCIFIVCFFLIVFIFFTITEFKPKEREKVNVSGEGFFTLNPGDSFQVMSWNIGYGALGDNADFFMDHGDMVQTASRDRINKNLNSIRNKIQDTKPQILFLQEVDISSKRARHVNELSSFRNHLNNYSSAFATNFKVTYLPYPLFDTIGHVHSGIATFSKYTIGDAERIQLPSSFIWPVSTVNLKRCLLITRLPIKDSDKELVLINLHLEAYDSGKGKELQTEKLLEILKEEKEKGNYVIAGGDFNQSFDSVDLSKYPLNEKLWTPGTIKVKDFGEGWQTFMDSETPSCRSLDQPYKDADKDHFQYYVIDGFIVSDNIKVDSFHTENLDFVASDHNPVLMKVTLT